MKFTIIFWFVIGVGLGAKGMVFVTDKAIDQVTGNSLENLSRLKQDCEKSGKECVMIYDFVVLEDDYE